MNEQERTELARLKEQQARLQSQLDQLSSQLRVLEQRLSEPEEANSPIPPPLTAPAPKTRPPILVVERNKPAESAIPKVGRTAPPPIPPVIPKLSPISPAPAPPPPALARPTEPPTAGMAKPEGSLEMRLGTYWAPRVGIVAVLTALVFFANLAYQTYISRL